jgi:hypothetical protein
MQSIQNQSSQLGIFTSDVMKELNAIFLYYLGSQKFSITGNRIISVYDSIGSELTDIIQAVCSKFSAESLPLDLSKNEDLSSIINQMTAKVADIENKNKKQDDIIKEPSKPSNIQKEIDKITTDGEKPSSPHRKILILNYPYLVNKTEFETANRFIDNFSKKVPEILKISSSIPFFLIIIIGENNQIPREVTNLVDYSILVPYPDKIKRLEIVDKMLSDLEIHTVEINELADSTENWNVKDLQRLINAGYMKWKLLNMVDKDQSLDNDKETEGVKSENLSTIIVPEIKEKEPAAINSSDNNQVKDFLDAVDKNEKKSKKSTKSNKESTIKDKITAADANILSGAKIDIKSIEPLKFDNKAGIETNFLMKNTKLDYIIPFTMEIFRTIISKKQVLPLNEYYSEEIIKNVNEMNTSGNYGLLNSILSQSSFSVGSISRKPTYSTTIQKGSMSKLDDLNDAGVKNDDFQILRSVNSTELNSFTSTQFYQFAASQKFDELVSVVEKLDQGKQLDGVDRNLLADYAFILKEEPKKALVRLTNAKNRIDKIRKVTKENKDTD